MIWREPELRSSIYSLTRKNAHRLLNLIQHRKPRAIRDETGTVRSSKSLPAFHCSVDGSCSAVPSSVHREFYLPGESRNQHQPSALEIYSRSGKESVNRCNHGQSDSIDLFSRSTEFSRGVAP